MAINILVYRIQSGCVNTILYTPLSIDEKSNLININGI